LLFSITFGNLFLGSEVKDESTDLARLFNQTNSWKKMNEYPLEYTVVDHYANGESIERGTTNSLNPSIPARINAEYTHPLSKNQTAILGSEEVALLRINFGGPEYSLGENLKYAKESKELNSTTGFMDKWGDPVTIGGSNQGKVSEMAVGDFDGNFRDDLVIVKRENGMSVEILENWAGMGFQLTVRSNLWNGEMIPAVVAGDIDGDYIDEFMILALNQSVPHIWVFEDIVDSTPRDMVYYGDQIMLGTVEAPNSYIYSERNSPNIYREEINDAAAPEETQFTILKASNLTYTGPIQYGDNVVIKDNNNSYWRVDDQTSAVNTDVTNVSSISASNIFMISSDRSQNDTSGSVYYHQYCRLEDYKEMNIKSRNKGESITADTMKNMNNWFKIVSNETLPFSLKSIHTLSDTDFTLIDNQSRELPVLASYHTAPNSIVTGDIDDDSRDEIIVVGMNSEGYARAWVFDDKLNDFTELHEFSWGTTIEDINPEVATGDIDGDGRDEIIFSFTRYNYGRVEIYEDGLGPLKYGSLKNIVSINDELHGNITKMTTGDIDGDGLDEIVFENGTCWFRVWDDSVANYALLGNWQALSGDLYDITYWDPPIVHHAPLDLVCGDIDIDGKEEILQTTLEYEIPNVLTLAFKYMSVWDYNETDFTHLPGYISADPVGLVIPKVATGDFNGDHLTLKYIDHDTYTTKEHIFCVMAAPPTQSGISQNYGDSSTEYGKGHFSSTTDSHGGHLTFGAYASLDISVTAGFLLNLKIAKIEAEASLVGEFAYTRTVTSTTTYITTYSGDATYDYVIFSACLYDVFIYEIVNGPERSVGRNYTIHLPNTPETYKWDLEYFDNRKSSSAPDLSETFNHTIGYIPSYPSKEDLDLVYPKRTEHPDGMQVGKGGGTNSLEIDLTKEYSDDFDWGATLDWKLSGGSVVQGGLTGSIGYHGGYSHGWGRDTMFSGTVGDIEDDNDYANFRYKFSLSVYKKFDINETEMDMIADLLEAVFGEDPREMDFGLVPPREDNNPYLAHSNKSLEYDKLIYGFNAAGLSGLVPGDIFYVINYWVETPAYWGVDAQQPLDFGSDVNNLLDKFEVPGGTVFSLLILAIPIFHRLRQKREQKS
jgi:hypothetical protein